jgi:hypothetical protein
MTPLTKNRTFYAPLNIDDGHTNINVHKTTKHEMMFTLTDPEEAHIEWVVNDGEFVEHIGLWFRDKSLVDYDGVFELPEQVITWLNEMGYNTEEI